MLIQEKATGLKFWALEYDGFYTEQKDIDNFLKNTGAVELDVDFRCTDILCEFCFVGANGAKSKIKIPLARVYNGQYIIYRGGSAFEVRDNLDGFERIDE